MTTWTGYTRVFYADVPRRARAAALLSAFLAPVVALGGVALLLGAATDALTVAGAPPGASLVLGVVAFASALLLLSRAGFAGGLAAAIVSGAVAVLFARAGSPGLAVLPGAVAVLACVAAALDIDGPFARRGGARDERTQIVRRRVIRPA